MLTVEEARGKVIEQIGKKRGPRATAVVSVWDALGLVLAQQVKTDREYPPFDRSTRDGYAVRSKEAAPGAVLKCVGEIKAGDTVKEALAAGACLQIMTGEAAGIRGVGAGGASWCGALAMREAAAHRRSFYRGRSRSDRRDTRGVSDSKQQQRFAGCAGTDCWRRAGCAGECGGPDRGFGREDRARAE